MKRLVKAEFPETELPEFEDLEWLRNLSQKDLIEMLSDIYHCEDITAAKKIYELYWRTQSNETYH